MKVRWVDGLVAFLSVALAPEIATPNPFPEPPAEHCDPFVVRAALNKLSWEGIASMTCLDADVERKILVFSASDLVDEDAEEVMRQVIAQILDSDINQKLGIDRMFQLIALKRE